MVEALIYLSFYLLVLCVCCLIADFVIPHIPFVKRYLESIPDLEEGGET